MKKKKLMRRDEDKESGTSIF